MMGNEQLKRGIEFSGERNPFFREVLEQVKKSVVGVDPRNNSRSLREGGKKDEIGRLGICEGKIN